MFGSRRHRTPSLPLTRETANPNAATAAASAFLRRETTPSLSSAAAAAALKARPTTPTNVSQPGQTKSGSSSIAECEFHDRADLPVSFAIASQEPAPQAQDVPPVPKIPQNEQVKSDTKNPTRKRATSLQTQSFQTASQKMKNDQGTWFGAAAAGDMSNMRRATVVDKRAQSNNAMVYDPNSRRMVPQAQLLIQEQNVRDASEKPTRKHKHENSKAGSHLSKGTLGRLKGTAVEPVSPPPKPSKSAQSEPVVQAAVTQPEQAKEVSQAKPEPEPAPEPDLESKPDIEREIKHAARPNVPEEQMMDESDVESEGEASRQAARTVASPPQATKPESSIRKRPSIVHEDREQEEEYEPNKPTISRERSMDGVDAIPVKSTTPPQTQTSVLVDQQNETVRRTRVHSESPARSPARTTHFAPKTDQLIVRHEPPPRSLSPRKSALKYSSPRDASPSEDGSDASVAWSGMAREDSDALRKKSVRVSFDDGNTAIMGEAAPAPDTDSPRLASPQSKKPWHSIIGRNKKDSITLDEDETMTPVPLCLLSEVFVRRRSENPRSDPLFGPRTDQHHLQLLQLRTLRKPMISPLHRI
ncbi:hypothetical protein NXS19_005230 [Fusarium pseudograminearum]|nr:hypothetical protein NXS19_005230 [Fusarium pseudograminearum]